jgi:hypothetical protein
VEITESPSNMVFTINRRVFRVITTDRRLSCQQRAGPYYAYGRQKLLPNIAAKTPCQQDVITRRLSLLNALELCSARAIHRGPDGAVVDDGQLVLPDGPIGKDRHMGNYDWIDWIERSEVGPFLRHNRFFRRDALGPSWYLAMAFYSNRRLFLMHDYEGFPVVRMWTPACLPFPVSGANACLWSQRDSSR